MKSKLIKQLRLIFIAVILGLLIIGGIKTFNELEKDPELAGKPPYSFLQGAEERNRDGTKEQKLIFENRKNFCGVGIRQEGNLEGKRFWRTWILLNYSDEINGTYTLGDEGYSLTQQDYSEMEKACKIDPRVSEELKKHLSE